MGPTPILSTKKFQYYVVFVDDCNGFTWLCPLCTKSDLYKTFVDFDNYV